MAMQHVGSDVTSVLLKFECELENEGSAHPAIVPTKLECMLIDCFGSLPGYLDHCLLSPATAFCPVLSKQLPTVPFLRRARAQPISDAKTDTSDKAKGKAISHDQAETALFERIVTEASRQLRQRWSGQPQWLPRASSTVQFVAPTDPALEVAIDWPKWVRSRQDSIFGRLCLNDGPDAQLHELTPEDGDVRADAPSLKVIQPANSGFLLTDLLLKGPGAPRGWAGLVGEAGRRSGVDLLVIDPPYPNHSADRLSGRMNRKRKRDKETGSNPASAIKALDAYATVDLYDLWALKTPVRDLLHSGGSQRGTLVAVWVTHHPKAKKFILQKLFPAWNVTFVREMLWMKVLASPALDAFCMPSSEQVDHGCEPIFEAGCGRKSYEILILGRFGELVGDSLPVPVPGFAGKVSKSRQAHKPDEGKTRAEWTWTDPPGQDEKHVIIASVPVGHSTKPYLGDALSRYLPRRCVSSLSTSRQQQQTTTTATQLFVELFARGVLGSAGSTGADGARSSVQISVGDEAVKRNVADVTVRPLRAGSITSKR